jgi:ATP-dependent Lon protease
VLEYLLGQYCATDDEDTIIHGVETVKGIISKHFVHRDEAQLIKSTIRDKGAPYHRQGIGKP